MLEEQCFEPIKIWVAGNREGAEVLKRVGHEPILLQEEDRILIWFKIGNTRVMNRIMYGNRWSNGEDMTSKDGYIFYEYTGLGLEELLAHISNPNKFRGVD